MRASEISESFGQPDLKTMLVRLDMALTGKDKATAEQSARNQARVLADPEAFLTMGDAYYLSDGGYSRVKASDETGRLVLLSQSRQEVKDRWQTSTVQREVKDIEDALRQFLIMMGHLDDDRYAHLPGSDAISALRPQIAAAAQEVYDGWDQSDPDNDDLNGGGICHLIADKIVGILMEANVPCTSQSSTHEQHVYVVAQCSDGVFEVDIPHRLYERGAAFTWHKVPGVIFKPEHVVVEQLNSDPAKMAEYVDEWEDEADDDR